MRVHFTSFAAAATRVNAAIVATTVSAVLVLGATQAGAASPNEAPAPLTPQDFAYGMTVQAEGAAAAYVTVLPLEVYQGVTQAGLSDLAVFNERGEVVPHVLEAPRSRPPVPETLVPFPVFVLRGEASKAMDAVRVSIEAAGTRINVEGPAAPTSTIGNGVATPSTAVTVGGATTAPSAVVGAAAPADITSYVLDARALKRPIAALEIGWPDGAPQFAGRLRVEASDDLGYWQTVVDAAPIANLRAGDSRLIERRVETRSLQAKYWRLSWVGERAPFEITSVAAEPSPVGRREQVGRQALSFNGAPVAGKPGEFEFDLGAHVPADRVNVELPELNSVVEVQLLSRGAPNAPWLPVTRNGFYRLKSSGTDLVNGDVRIAPNPDRYWLARVDMRGNGLGSSAPKLRVAWAPHEIVFLARGAGPFILAFGSASLAAPTGRISAIPESAHVLPATLGEREILGGEARLNPVASGFPFKSTILWAVLGLAVALLAYMAYRLARDLKRPEPKAD